MGKYLSIIIILFLSYSCNSPTNKECDNSKKLYRVFYDQLERVKESRSDILFKKNYDSTNFHLDKLLACYPTNTTLLNQKIGLLSLNKDFQEMITIYDKLLVSDLITAQQKEEYNFGKFYSMVLSDSVKYKKDIKEYYYTIKNKNLTQLLSNPDVYKDQPEIYKRMKLSYFFEGRSKTLKTFSPIKDKIPYKFKYDIIKDSLKSPLEFLKDGMDYR